MKVGLSWICQNPCNNLNGQDVYPHEVCLATQSEALGYDFTPSLGNHFTGHTRCRDVIQGIALMAGKAGKDKLGSLAESTLWNRHK